MNCFFLLRVGKYSDGTYLETATKTFTPRDFIQVNLHEAFWREDQCLIVMDLASGGNLFDKLPAAIGKQVNP